MSDSPATRADAARAHYDQAAASAPDFSLMNYGYCAPSDDSVVADGAPEVYCLRLYEHAVRDTVLNGRDVLEISCGRGGGAAFLAKTFGPRRYVGVDVSAENIRIATALHHAGNLEFGVGNAESLEFADASFDVAVNIEASHLYDDRKAFFDEVFRVLRPGGRFCYVDGCWKDDDCTADLAGAGFALLERRNITANVLEALRRDSPRREAIVDAMPAEMREQYRDWSGVVGYRAFSRFESGETLYFSHLLERPRG
ncbi:MAG: class I SAM-dependent methyltransferase [Gammaproteobacteria bacterium]|nr:class I SAM-dependent methyltransferase [Gammaproteobacteria bacterium]